MNSPDKDCFENVNISVDDLISVVQVHCFKYKVKSLKQVPINNIYLYLGYFLFQNTEDDFQGLWRKGRIIVKNRYLFQILIPCIFKYLYWDKCVTLLK